MEVLKEEFEAKFELIKQAISEADFIAFDCEFTGLFIFFFPSSSFSITEYLLTKF